MNREQFLKKLKSLTKRRRVKWHVDQSGSLRCKLAGRTTCPVCFVAGGPGVGAWIAGESISLREKSIDTIVASADNQEAYGRVDKKVRRQLFAAVGLKETA